MRKKDAKQNQKNVPLSQVDIFDTVNQDITTIPTGKTDEELQQEELLLNNQPQTNQETKKLTFKEKLKLRKQQKQELKQKALEEKRKRKLTEFTKQLESESSSDTPYAEKKRLKTIMDIVDDRQAEEDDGDKTIFSKLFDKSVKPSLEVEKVIERFNPDAETGLTKQQVEQRIKEGCTNKSTKRFSKSYKTIVLENVFTFFNLLCFVLAGVLIYYGSYTDCIFMLVCLANMGIGLFQEIRAKQTIDKLSLVSAPTAKVVRDGAIIEIDTQSLVIDDIMLLSNGKQICSDSIIVSGNVEVNESLLTGESISVKKTVGDKLYSGSFVVSGNCVAKVEKVGKHNYVEVLQQKAKKYKKPHSEIMSSLNIAIKAITGFIIIVGTLMFFNNLSTNGGDIKLTVTSTSGSIIGMIPSGLFLLTSLALAVSVLRLAKNKTLVQDLYCIEMLARVDVLCLDKTGTITDGKMNVQEVVVLKDDLKTPVNHIIGSMLANLGDSNQTNIALTDYFGTSKRLKKVDAIPFSSERKYSAVSFTDGNTYVLGAPEFVLSNISSRLEQAINNYAQSGLRVLLLASSKKPIKDNCAPNDLAPVALIVIQDHIRDDAAETIKWFMDSGVAIKVISGDNPVAVSEIARRVGIENAEKYISLEGLSGTEVAAIANDYTVFGRVTPEQKAILVKSMKVAGRTVAMTGDGVNDILAMKESNCAIAMASGAEAARNVSHLVLLDSNFASMPKVVREGRRVINNIKNSASLFLMKTIYTILLSLFVLISHIAYPFTPKNMAILEFAIIGVASFFLALEPNNNRVTGKFLPGVIKRSLPAGISMFLNVVALFILSNFYPLTAQELTTMGIYCVTFAGFLALLEVCKPFSWYKAALVSIILIFIIAWINILPSIVGLTALSLDKILITIIMVQATYPLMKLLLWASQHFDKFIVPKGE